MATLNRTVSFKVNDGTSDSNVLARPIAVTLANDQPAVTAIANQTISINSSTGPLSFTISDAETAALAKLALAGLFEQQGKDAEAREQYQYLVDHPTTMVPKGRAQLALARYLSTREPEKAKEILNELVQQPGVLGGAATAALRELQGS